MPDLGQQEDSRLAAWCAVPDVTNRALSEALEQAMALSVVRSSPGAVKLLHMLTWAVARHETAACLAVQAHALLAVPSGCALASVVTTAHISLHFVCRRSSDLPSCSMWQRLPWQSVGWWARLHLELASASQMPA